MSTSETGRPTNLGIVGWDQYEYIVSDVERSRRFYTQNMSVPEVARLDSRRAGETGEDALFFAAGKARVVCVIPKAPGSRAERWLKRHPEGVAVLGVRVRNAEQTHRLLEERGATFITEIVDERDGDGRPYRWFEIATPLGDVRFRFIERASGALPPGFLRIEPASQTNPYDLQVIDHVTSNFLTIEPHVTWLRDVMGFEEYWRVHFHTADIRGGEGGSGLASIVMWDPESGVKLANNEPAAPNYEASQIYRFVEANHGPGVQHVAFHLPKIVTAVEGLKRSGIDFLDTPMTYYDMLPQRLAERHVSNFRDNIEELKHLGILVDGEDDRYLLQIFMVEGGVMYADEIAGPFFYELIQRRGARGFGEGNFRALFEAIERDQNARTALQSHYISGAAS
jgi:4-hydroxyphenylpyruvate dioxygenase